MQEQTSTLHLHRHPEAQGEAPHAAAPHTPIAGLERQQHLRSPITLDRPGLEPPPPPIRVECSSLEEALLHEVMLDELEQIEREEARELALMVEAFEGG